MRIDSKGAISTSYQNKWTLFSQMNLEYLIWTLKNRPSESCDFGRLPNSHSPFLSNRTPALFGEQCAQLWGQVIITACHVGNDLNLM